MLGKKERDAILSQYPETMSKEQFCHVCHVSKRYARFLLEEGVVPCRIRKCATHKYVIATMDVIRYLEKRPKTIRKGKEKPDSDCESINPLASIHVHPELITTLQTLYEQELEPYPDVMDAKQVSKAIGYSDTTVNKWCAEGRIRHFSIRKIYHIPKPWLIDYLLTPRFICQPVMSGWHQTVVLPTVMAFIRVAEKGEG